MVIFLLYINPISLLINRIYLIFRVILIEIIFSMADKLCEIDLAMNMIKEDIIRELSESVSKQNKNHYYRQTSSKDFSFSDKSLD